MTRASDTPMRHYREKWGFGMAPIKPEVLRRRRASAARLTDFLEEGTFQSRGRLELLSTDIADVKGLFSRAFKQDQWDWFTTWSALGNPGRAHAREAATALADLRVSVRDGMTSAAIDAGSRFAGCGGRTALARFQDDSPRDGDNPGIGYVYVLSTREQPQLLKIGYTDRSIEQRVAEINRATGVAVPYGARSVWRVQAARDVEAAVHSLLSEYRLRADREFFQLEWREAKKRINVYLREQASER